MESQYLSKEDSDLFYKLYWSLMFHANSKLDRFRGFKHPSDFSRVQLENVVQLRDILYNRNDLIASFVKENPFNFTLEELTTIESWKNPIRGEFIVLKHHPDYTVFMGGKPTRAYGVIGLKSSLSGMIPNEILPIFVKTALFPFKGKIIYDGIFETSNVRFGSRFRKNVEQECKELELKHGIITSFTISAQKQEPNDEELMRFYMKTKDNRERYAYEAYKLSDKSPEMKALYHKELGRARSASLRQEIRRNHVKDGTYFAVLGSTAIASGTSQIAVEKIIREILPEDRWNWVFIFKK